MSYQIPERAQVQILTDETTVAMFKVKPTGFVKAENAVVTMFIKGHIGSDFKMRVNLYKDEDGNNILISSTAVNNQDITRIGDYYCEIRFDFPTLNNRMAVGIDHLVEFEIYDGYVYSASNYVALILDYAVSLAYFGSDSILLIDPLQLSHRVSMFFGYVQVQTDEKFFMMRMQGARLFIGQENVTTYSAGTYSLYEEYIQANLWLSQLDSDKCYRGDTSGETSLIRAISPIVPNPGDYTDFLDTYYYDPSTGRFQFYTLTNTSQWIILEYYLFFTEYIGRYADPYMSEISGVVYWEPRLIGGMTFDFSQQNNLNGILSISASTIQLKNQDKYMNEFFGVKDCFNNREVVCWRCEGNVDNFTLEFVGTIRNASINDSVCTFELQDRLAILDNNYNDEKVLSVTELGYSATATRAIDNARIVPRLFGKCGPYELADFDTGQELSVGFPALIKRLNGEKMTPMVNVSYNGTPATSNNRTWSIGFGDTVSTDLVVDVTAVASHTIGTSFQSSKLTLDVGLGIFVNEYFAPGDTIINNGQYGIIYSVDNTDIYVWPYNASFSASFDLTRQKVPAIIIKNGEDIFYPLSGRDYSCAVGAGGDMQITFTNNFEASHSGLVLLDCESMEVFGRMWNDTADGKASEVIKEIINYTGLESSFPFAPAQDPANPDAYLGRSYPDPLVSFTLPFSGSEEMPTFREVIELLLKTTMGFIYFDDGGAVRYKTFLDGIHAEAYIDNQSGLDPRINGIDEKNTAGLSVSHDLFDLYTGVKFQFPQNPEPYLPDSNYAPNAKKALYKSNKIYAVDIVADQNAPYFTTYIENYVKLVTGRRTSYSLNAFTTYGAFIGDDLLLTRSKIIGSDGESFMRVVSISKAINDQKLTLLDLRRFPE